jgi:hypothetical protein
MTISAMAIFRFPVVIGESDLRDRGFSAIVSPGFERVDSKFRVIVKYGIECSYEEWSVIWTYLNIYSEDWVQLSISAKDFVYSMPVDLHRGK